MPTLRCRCTERHAPQQQLALPVGNILKGFGDLSSGGFSWLAGWELWGGGRRRARADLPSSAKPTTECAGALPVRAMLLGRSL